MESWSPTTLFVAHYLVAGATAFCLLIKNGEGISLKTIGYTGFYSLLGGTFAPVMSELPFAVSVSKVKLSVAYAAAIGGGFVAIPQLATIIKRGLKTWVGEDENASKKD